MIGATMWNFLQRVILLQYAYSPNLIQLYANGSMETRNVPKRVTLSMVKLPMQKPR